MTRSLPFIFALSLLGACAQTTPPVATTPEPATSSTTAPAPTPSDPLVALHAFTLADLQAASADAKANSDTTAAPCYDFLAANLPSLPGFSPGQVGAILAFQKARDLVNGVSAQSGFLKSLNIACAPLVNDVNFTVAKLGIIAGGVAATGGALAPAAGLLPVVNQVLPVLLQ